MLKIAAVLVLLVVGIGATVFAVVGVGPSSPNTSQYLTSAVTQGTVSRTAVATGNVSVATQYGLAFGSPPAFITSASSTGAGAGGSYLVASVSVAPGDVVTAGQALATSDTTQLQVALETALANATAAQAKLDTDQGGPTPDTIAAAQDSVTAAQQSATVAQQAVGSTEASNSLSVAQAQQQLANAERQYATDLRGPDSSTLASAQDSITQAQLNLKTAQQNVDTTKASDLLSIQSAQTALAAAQQNVADTAASNTIALQSAQAALAQAQQNVTDTSTQNDLSVASAQGGYDAAYQAYLAVANPPSGPPDPAKLVAAQAAYDQAQAALTGAKVKATTALRNAQNQVDAAQASLDSAHLKTDQATRSAAAAVTSAQAAVTSAQQRATQAETAAANQVLSAQNALTAAQHNYDLKVQPSSVTLANDLQAIANAQLSVKSAQLNAQKAAQNAANQVQTAKQSLTAAQHGYATKVATVSAAQIAADQASVASAQNALATAQKALDNAILTAPMAGTVVAVNIAAGSMAPSGYAVTIQGRDLQVVANFTETDLPSLALQQTATVTVSAVSATVNGVVKSIAPQAASSTTGGVVSYAVTIALVDPPANVHVGMSAQAAVVTASAPNVLTVASVALRGSSGNYTVQVLDATGVPQAVPVTVGLVASGLAEVQSGLTEGERVVTGTVSSRQGTTTPTGGGIAIPGGLGGGGFGSGGGGGGRGGGGGTGQ